MDVQEVVDLVNRRLTYKDGWQFDARVRESRRADHQLVAHVEWQAVVDNSSPRRVDPRPRVIATGEFDVTPGPKEKVEDQIITGIREGEDHELREFFRIDGFAPYHPHRDDGDQRWAHRW